MKTNRFNLETITIFSVVILAFGAIANTAPHSSQESENREFKVSEETSAEIVQGQAPETLSEMNVLPVCILLGTVAIYALSVVLVTSTDYFEALWKRDHNRALDEAYYLAMEDVFPRRVAGWRYFANNKLPGSSLVKKVRSGKSY